MNLLTLIGSVSAVTVFQCAQASNIFAFLELKYFIVIRTPQVPLP
jgi:hypothetical protein